MERNSIKGIIKYPDNNYKKNILAPDSKQTFAFIHKLIYNFYTSTSNYLEGTYMEKKGIKVIKDILYIESEEFPNHKIKFRTPFSIFYTDEEGFYTYEIPELQLYGYGETINDMMENFRLNILDSWVYYAICDENELNQATLPLRQQLLSLLEAC